MNGRGRKPVTGQEHCFCPAGLGSVTSNFERVRKGTAMARKSAKKANEAVRPVCFELLAPEAKQVCVAGNFNDWDAGDLPMTRDVDGNWRVSVALKPGSYEYRFVVDGVWQNDPRAQRTVANSYGSCNCIVEVS